MRAGWLAAALAAPALAAALDVPAAGRRIELRAAGSQRRAAIVLRDAAIQAPFPDPRAGATLVVSGGAGAGACFADVTLDPAAWRPIRGVGVVRGWRYHDPRGRRAGIRRVVVRPGYLAVDARGAAWPCRLDGAQRVPLTVELRVGGTRWCGAFGGDVRANARGRFRARNAAAPAACPKPDVTLTDLNVLHGLFCPPATGSCRQAERTALLYEWIVRRGCPDAVVLQEVWDPAVPLLAARAADACPFPYTVLRERANGVDDAMLLSRWPVVEHEIVPLLRNFRHVLWARIDHPAGPLDVFTTHLASGADGAQQPCGPDCPPECVAAGAATVRQCQGVQVGAIVAARHRGALPALVAGDFNEPPGSFVYEHLVGRGWIDSFLAAGNAECDPGSGLGCTSGREDESLADLESPARNVDERIDYAFVVPAAATCRATLDPPSDADGDGTATRLFADLPNPAAADCGPAPAPICWPSDHVGTEVDLGCF